MKKRIKSITALITAIIMVMTMRLIAFADTAPVIDMGTFHIVYHALPSDENYTVSGIKITLEGKELEDQEISLQVEQKETGDFSTPLTGGFTATVKNSAEGTVSFKPGSYTDAGKYYYLVKALMPDEKYSGTVSEAFVTVTVTDQDGELTPEVDIRNAELKITYIRPNDPWISNDWDYEVVNRSGMDYIVLKKYTGTDKELVIYGEATANGKTGPVLLGLEYNDGTGAYESFINGNTNVEKVKFISVNGTQVKTEIDGKANELFKSCNSIKSVDFNNSFGGKLKDISGMFEGCTSITNADLTGLDLSSCEKAVKTFKNCTNVTEANLTGADFGKLKDASEFFAGCLKLSNPNLAKARWNTSIEKTDRMFAGARNLNEITIPEDFAAGSSCTEMFRLETETRLLVKGSPSKNFKDRVFPGLKDSRRYLGEIGITAHVSLRGNTLKAEMFTCKLYQDSVKDENLLTSVKNDSAGNYNFVSQKVYDITKPLKFIAVQDDVANMTNETGNLTKEVTIELKQDGSLATGE
ncbi:MAG: BspA family leucine-rich repeat surface protein [Lachnospiraceae bacterium]|nr:BspA family leucine-rich repeat surface protein [Lachnospiraceae bacterium]